MILWPSLISNGNIENVPSICIHVTRTMSSFNNNDDGTNTNSNDFSCTWNDAKKKARPLFINANNILVGHNGIINRFIHIGNNNNNVNTNDSFAITPIDRYWRKSMMILAQYQILATLSSNIPLEKGNCRCNTFNNDDIHVSLLLSLLLAYIQKGAHNIPNVIITVIANFIKCTNINIIVFFW